MLQRQHKHLARQAAITAKPVYVVTSIKQSPVLEGHLFLVLS